jgi:hypothetical protein
VSPPASAFSRASGLSRATSGKLHAAALLTRVVFAVESWSGNNPFAAMAFGAMAGATILGLVAWWNFRKVAPIRQRWLGNFLYEAACTCSVILAVVGSAFAWGFYNGNNPYWELISPFTIVVFWSNALIC